MKILLQLTRLFLLLQARKKTIEKVKPEDLGVDIESRLKTILVEEPPVRKAGVKVSSVDDLVSALKKDGIL